MKMFGHLIYKKQSKALRQKIRCRTWPPLPNRFLLKVVREPKAETQITSMLPGFSHFMNKRLTYKSRIIWLILSLLAYGMCIYQTESLMNDYICAPTTLTKFYVANKTVEFPTVMVCPDIDFQSKSAFSSDLLIKTLMVNSSDDIDTLLKNNKITVFDIWDATGLYMKNIMPHFLDPQTKSRKEKSQGKNLFLHSRVYTTLGACHTITPKQPLQFGDSQLYVEYEMENGPIQVSTVRVMLQSKEDSHFNNYFAYHNSFVLYTQIINDFGYTVSSTNEYTVHVNQHIWHKECGNETARICLVDCLRRYLLLNATSESCRLPFLQEFDMVPLCNSLAKISQMISAVLNFTYKFKIVDCLCPKRCCENEYRWQKDIIISAAYNTSLTIKVHQNIIPVVEEETQNTWLFLLCDLAGSMNLWLGICGLQIIEIIEKFLSDIFEMLKDSHEQNAVIPTYTFVSKYYGDNAKQLGQELLGFQRITKLNSPLWVRSIWAIITLGSSLFTVFQCSELLLYFFSCPSVTKVSYINKKNVLFPELTFCADPINHSLPALNPMLSSKQLAASKLSDYVLLLLENRSITIENIWKISNIRPAFEDIKFLFNSAEMILHNNEDMMLTKYLPKLTGFILEKYGNQFMELQLNEIHRSQCEHNNIVTQCKVRCIELNIISLSSKYCRLPYMLYSTSIPACKTRRDLEIVLNATLATLKTVNLEDCSCPKKCKEILYTVAYHGRFSDISTEFTERPSYSQITFSIVKGSTEILEINPAYNVFALFSHIGGAMGLLFGIYGLMLLNITFDWLSTTMSLFKECFLKRGFKETSKNSRIPMIIVKTTTKRNPHRVNKTSNSPPCHILCFKSTSSNGRQTWIRISGSVVCLIVLGGACIYQCAERISYYYSDPSEIKSYYTINSSIFHPLITVCPCDKGNLTNIQVNQHPTEDIAVSKMFTLAGLCTVIYAGQQVLHAGKYHSISGTIAGCDLSKTFINAAFSTEEIYQIPYAVLNNINNIKFSNKAILNIRILEVVHRNTSQNPCYDGETVAKCLLTWMENRIVQNISISYRLPLTSQSLIEHASVLIQLFYTDARALAIASNFEFPEDYGCPRKCKNTVYNYESHTESNSERDLEVEFSLNIPDNRIYTLHEISAYPIFRLLSDLGGTLGLYFGLGFLQMFELIFAVILNLYNYIFTCKVIK